MGITKSENFWGCSVHHSPNPDDELKNFLSRLSWSDECWFFSTVFSDRLFGFRTHVVATAVCTTGERYTHSPVARTFFCAQRTHCVLRTSSCVSHTRMAQGCLKKCLHMCRLSSSRLHSHDSPILAVPWRSLRDHSRLRLHWLRHPQVLAVLYRPESVGHAPLRTCIAKFGYLAKSDANTGCEPKKFDKITSVDDDKMLINDPNHNFSDF